ncbi:histidine phosphatase family protein [uncultured Luteimonas sp.]|uniref:histidine phosphatase family protein n=1 Tax=uncultured Luteimonas sp. TaxID=453144 RepID=UPI0026310318|nr:histidine phosphatase family protein [uncultured Luteimonas sp.]
MKLLVVRHGETRFNAEHRYLGALDPDLNAKGVSQALVLSSTLPRCVDAIVCSPLQRARRTAEIIGSERGQNPTVIDAFRERNVGVFEGLTQAEAQARFPELWSQNVTRLWEGAPTGGETIDEVVTRVAKGLDDLYESHAGRAVALVAHGFVAKVVRAICRTDFQDFFEWQLANAAVCELTLTANNSFKPMPLRGTA